MTSWIALLTAAACIAFAFVECGLLAGLGMIAVFFLGVIWAGASLVDHGWKPGGDGE